MGVKLGEKNLGRIAELTAKLNELKRTFADPEKKNPKKYLELIEKYKDLYPAWYNESLEKGIFKSTLYLGLPFRLPKAAWQKYGMETKGMAESPLITLAQLDYVVEWHMMQLDNLRMVAEAAKAVGIGDANRKMNLALGEMTAERTASLEEIRALDIGAGGGDTTLAFLTALFKKGYIGTIHLTITDIDESIIRKLTKENLPTMAVEKGFITEEEKEAFSKWLKEKVSIRRKAFNMAATPIEELGEVTFNLVMANAALHHTPDVPFVLHRLYKIMGKGYLAIGEWTHDIHVTPAMQMEALATLSNIYERGDKEKLLQAFSEKHGENNAAILHFWVEVAEKAKAEGKISPILYLEGHLPEEYWITYAQQVGFKLIESQRLPLPSGAMPEENRGLNTLLLFEKGESVGPEAREVERESKEITNTTQKDLTGDVTEDSTKKDVEVEFSDILGGREDISELGRGPM